MGLMLGCRCGWGERCKVLMAGFVVEMAAEAGKFGKLRAGANARKEIEKVQGAE